MVAPLEGLLRGFDLFGDGDRHRRVVLLGRQTAVIATHMCRDCRCSVVVWVMVSVSLSDASSCSFTRAAARKDRRRRSHDNAQKAEPMPITDTLELVTMKARSPAAGRRGLPGGTASKAFQMVQQGKVRHAPITATGRCFSTARWFRQAACQRKNARGQAPTAASGAQYRVGVGGDPPTARGQRGQRPERDHRARGDIIAVGPQDRRAGQELAIRLVRIRGGASPAQRRGPKSGPSQRGPGQRGADIAPGTPFISQASSRPTPHATTA